MTDHKQGRSDHRNPASAQGDDRDPATAQRIRDESSNRPERQQEQAEFGNRNQQGDANRQKQMGGSDDHSGSR